MPVPRNYNKPQSLSAKPKTPEQIQRERAALQQQESQQEPIASAVQLPRSDYETEQQWRQAKEAFEKTVKEFHEIIQIKRLEQNKTLEDKERERRIINGLYTASSRLDELNSGEGSSALAAGAFSELLFLRGRLNELEYHQTLMLKELRSLQKELGVKPNEQK